jgi:hypothetical protein
MFGLLIKIALGLAAFGLSALSAADLKEAYERSCAVGHRRWWLCITRFEAAKIFCALAMLALFVANEVITYGAQRDASQQSARLADELKAQLVSTDEKLEYSKAAVAQSMSALRAIKEQNDLLLSVADRAVQRVSVIRVMPNQVNGSGVKLTDQTGAAVRPKQGDSIQWAFVCRNGTFPQAALDHNAEFGAIGLGRLMANGFVMTLRSEAGQEIFFGTRTTGQELRYDAGSLASQRNHEAFKDAQCELTISVYREGKWLYDSDDGGNRNFLKRSVAESCRRFKLIYGEDCPPILLQNE